MYPPVPETESSDPLPSPTPGPSKLNDPELTLTFESVEALPELRALFERGKDMGVLFSSALLVR